VQILSVNLNISTLSEQNRSFSLVRLTGDGYLRFFSEVGQATQEPTAKLPGSSYLSLHDPV
jgi:hypothetical protein